MHAKVDDTASEGMMSSGSPGRRSGRSNMATLHPRQLTAKLSKASTLSELLSLQQRHGAQFDGIHVGAFWSRFKTLARGELGGLSHRLAPVCEQTVRMLPELDARQVANVAHAFATARLVGTGPCQNVWAALQEAVLRSLGELNPQHLANTTWAFATAGRESPELFDVISAEVVRRGLGGFNEQNLSNTTWAFAKADREAPVLFDLISAEVVRRGLGGFNEQNLSNTSWAFAKAGHAAPELFDAISAEAVRRGLGGFNAQDLSTTAWAFATAGHAAPELFDALSVGLACRRWGGFDEQNLTNTAWAFAVFDLPSASADELFSMASFTTRCAQFAASFSRENLSQLHQWSLWRQERGAQWPVISESLRQACYDAFVAREGVPSQLQSDVVREIRSTGDIANVEEEHRCKVSGYSIDALVTLKNGKQIAVEVDGPSHFLGGSQQPTGATLLKHRQLRHFGWQLLSVPYWDTAMHW